MADPSEFTVNKGKTVSGNSYESLGVHKEYRSHYPRWRFLSKSYLGGYEWKLG